MKANILPLQFSLQDGPGGDWNRVADLEVQRIELIVAAAAVMVAGVSLTEVAGHGLGAGVAAGLGSADSALCDLAQRRLICAQQRTRHGQGVV